jgi:hypothetical protein
MPSHFPAPACGGAGHRPRGGSHGQPVIAPSRVPTVPEKGLPCPTRSSPLHTDTGPDSRAWWIGPGFRRIHPEKLKIWKPDAFHGVAAPQNPRFPEFQDFTPTTGTGGGRPCTIPPADTQADFFITLSIRLDAQLAASSSVFVVRCA